MRKSLLMKLLVISALVTATGARADLIGTLTHVQPTGNVGPVESFGDLLQFTLGAGSDPVMTNQFGVITSDTFFDGINLNGGTFSTSVSSQLTFGGLPSSSYSLSFGPSGTNFFAQFGNLNLAVAGASFQFVASYWTPVGMAPAGAYTIGTATFLVFGPDTDSVGNAVSHQIAAAPDSGFSRTVVAAVPEPSTYALFLLGLAGVGFFARRRRNEQ